MNVLVFGKTGQVGLELMQYEGVTCLGRDEADLADAESLKGEIKKKSYFIAISIVKILFRLA